MKHPVFIYFAKSTWLTLALLIANTAQAQERIVSLSGTITEIACELGLSDQLVGIDITSTYPKAVNSLPKLGHVSRLNAEGLFSLNPTMVLGKKGEVSEDLVSKLEQAGIKVGLFTQEYTPEGTQILIKAIGKYCGKEKKANLLIKSFNKEIELLGKLDKSPKVLFIYARGQGTLMVAGTGTQMQAFIELAGATPAITEFAAFKPLTSEALLQANPDVILLFDSGLKSLDGSSGLLNVPGIAETEAGKNRRFVSMDGQLISGFGPRLPKAIEQFQAQLKEWFQ